jgi:hypothetical protein
MYPPIMDADAAVLDVAIQPRRQREECAYWTQFRTRRFPPHAVGNGSGSIGGVWRTSLIRRPCLAWEADTFP